MKYCFVKQIRDSDRKKWFVIYTTDSMEILLEPTQYCKHKINQHKSPNTVNKIAYSLSYYYCYLYEKNLTIEQVLNMKYVAQHKHFVDFLLWLKAGKHTDRIGLPTNATCNSYLEAVFGFILFLIKNEYVQGDIKVLERRDIRYGGTAGVRYIKSINTFPGYLKAEKSIGKTIEEDKIKRLLEEAKEIRNQLIILILADTGIRISELLGLRYAKDIDYEKRTIRVKYREDNVNDARAKRAQERECLISDDTYEILMIYISENRRLLKQSDYLIVSQHGPTRGKPLTRSAIYSMLEQLEKKTGIKATPHMLRHYYANERRKAGWKIELVSESLGHERVSTTEAYMHIEDQEVMDASKKYYAATKGLYDISKITTNPY